MAVALNPTAYASTSEVAPEGLGWRDPLDDDAPLLTRNPRFTITEEAHEVFALWTTCRSGMGGLAHLPEPGGVLRQNAWTMAAFDELNAAYAQLEDRKRPREAH